MKNFKFWFKLWQQMNLLKFLDAFHTSLGICFGNDPKTEVLGACGSGPS